MQNALCDKPLGRLGPWPLGANWARAPGEPLGPGPKGPTGPGPQGNPWARAPRGQLGPGPRGTLGPGPKGANWARAPRDLSMNQNWNFMFFCLFALPYIFSFAQLCPPMFFQLLPGPMVDLGSLFSYFYFILCRVYLKLPCTKPRKTITSVSEITR